MNNGDDDQKRTPQGIEFSDDEYLRNRMRLQEALRDELAGNVDWLIQSEQDLLKIFRFYLIVLGAFISILSILANQKTSIANLFNFYTVSAIAFWAIAVLGAIVAYTIVWAKIGIDDVHHQEDTLQWGRYIFSDTADVFDELDLRSMVNQSPDMFEEEMIDSYIRSIHHNEWEFGHVRYPFLWGGMALVSIAVLVFGIGVLDSITTGSRILVQDGKLQISTILFHVVGFTALFLGITVSRFLLRQTWALKDRISGKIENSAASNPPTVYGYIFNKVRGLIEGTSTTGNEDSKTGSKPETGAKAGLTDKSEKSSAEASNEATDESV